MSELCPCGSGRPLDQCCGPYLEGRAWPDDAGTMVRSRFSAYCLGKFDYLVETSHPAYREDLTAQMLEEQTRDVHWLRLDMGPCEKDQPEGGNGELFDTAEFYAYYELEGSVRQIGERSFFQRKDGKFDYLVETSHPAYREDLTAQMLEEQTRDVHWLRLDMGPCEKDQPEGGNGELFDTAEFYAYYELEGSVRQIGERSFFQRKDGKLYYVDGVARRPKAYRRPEPKVGRNDPCPCGSGKKYKKCCGRESA